MLCRSVIYGVGWEVLMRQQVTVMWLSILLFGVPITLHAEEPKLSHLKALEAQVISLQIKLGEAKHTLAAVDAKRRVCEAAVEQSATREALNELIDIAGKQRAFEASLLIPEGYTFDWNANPPALKKVEKK